MDLNWVILIGRLATEPEMKYTPSGIAVTQFRLAVNRPMSQEARQEARQNGQKEPVDFISIVVWRQSAEFAANYLHKGRLVAIEGRLQIREYETQDGQKRRDAEVVADNLKSLEPRPREAGENGGGRYNDEYGPENGARSSTPVAAARRPDAAPATAPRSNYPPPVEDDLDDPFADN